MAIQFDPNVESLADGIDDYGEKLARKYGMQDLLDVLQPRLDL